jgi:hypothetical protein
LCSFPVAFIARPMTANDKRYGRKSQGCVQIVGRSGDGACKVDKKSRV